MPATPDTNCLLHWLCSGRVLRQYSIRVALVTGVVLCSSGCMLKFDAWAPKRNHGLSIPKRYDASLPPVPDVTTGLLALFEDEQLSAYVDKALEHNPDLKGSAARLEESGFEMRKASSSLVPTVDLNGGVSRSQNSIRNSRSRENIYSAGLDAQWEIDVWGRIRAGIRATASNRDALLADYESARQSIAAQTMQSYFNLVAEDQLLNLAQRRLESFEKT